jgi:dihydrofolate reductase
MTLNKLAIISAMTRDFVIGKDNHLPWKISAELQYFKRMTMGKVMIMGKNTFMSLKMQALPGRTTIVVSSKLIACASNVEIASSIEQALELAYKHNSPEIIIAGGSKIYQQFLPLVDTLYLSFINQDYAGDAYFPAIDWHQWQLASVTGYQEFTAKVFTRTTYSHDT